MPKGEYKLIDQKYFIKFQETNVLQGIYYYITTLTLLTSLRKLPLLIFTTSFCFQRIYNWTV